MKLQEKIELILGIIILITLAGTLFNWSNKLIESFISWGTSILIGVIMSGISGEILEKFTGNSLKNVTWTTSFKEFNFSISLFLICTLIVRFWLFGI